MSPAALSEDGVAGVELHTGDVAVFLSAIGTDAHFTGSNGDTPLYRQTTPAAVKPGYFYA